MDIVILLWGIRGVTVIVLESEHSDQSSTLNETVFISHGTNILGKTMNLNKG